MRTAVALTLMLTSSPAMATFFEQGSAYDGDFMCSPSSLGIRWSAEDWSTSSQAMRPFVLRLRAYGEPVTLTDGSLAKAYTATIRDENLNNPRQCENLHWRLYSKETRLDDVFITWGGDLECHVDDRRYIFNIASSNFIAIDNFITDRVSISLGTCRRM